METEKIEEEMQKLRDNPARVGFTKEELEVRKKKIEGMYKTKVKVGNRDFYKTSTTEMQAVATAGAPMKMLKATRGHYSDSMNHIRFVKRTFLLSCGSLLAALVYAVAWPNICMQRERRRMLEYRHDLMLQEIAQSQGGNSAAPAGGAS